LVLSEQKRNTAMSNKEHPNADLLRAIADGKTLQTFNHYIRDYKDESDLSGVFAKLANEQVFNWRIKPDPPAEIVTHVFVEPVPKLDNAFNQPNLRLTFDGKTKALKKAEILVQV
jgi:hypothetical protein